MKRIDWREHLAPGATLACDCSGGNESIRHTIYGSQLLKDAVCDSLREATGERPNIEPERPDVLLHLHVEGATALLSVDFSGESLHRRGYRTEGGRAPLKENVAAAVLLRAGWPGIYAARRPAGRSDVRLRHIPHRGGLDRGRCRAGARAGVFRVRWAGADTTPRCGSGCARRRARAARRGLRGAASSARTSTRTPCARRSRTACSAGVGEWLHVERRALERSRRTAAARLGLVVANPPYGERIGAESALPALYSELGRTLRERFAGWQAAILTGNPPLARNLGIYAKRTHRVFNGAIECRLLRFDLNEASEQRPAEAVRADWSSRPGAQMFANRLRKNLARLEPWAEHEHIDCYRLYDADMPEYAFAIDVYGRGARHLFVQEYAPPRSVDQESARQRRREVLAVLPEVLAVPLAHVHSRVRKPQKGAGQYEKRALTAERHVVQEGGLKFWVNFRDYLDTGLFLDHRIVRGMLRDWARDTDFLNLFCYTGTRNRVCGRGRRAQQRERRSVQHLSRLGARESAAERLRRCRSTNCIARIVCSGWRAGRRGGPRFDLIFLDPPTFSNSKRMEGVLDVQRDHVGMIRRSLQLLRPAGRLVFSTNYTRFKLDSEALADLSVRGHQRPDHPQGLRAPTRDSPLFRDPLQVIGRAS